LHIYQALLEKFLLESLDVLEDIKHYIYEIAEPHGPHSPQFSTCIRAYLHSNKQKEVCKVLRTLAPVAYILSTSSEISA
jgi:hypothetical protein